MAAALVGRLLELLLVWRLLLLSAQVLWLMVCHRCCHAFLVPPGDHLEVLPRNSPALVASALELLGLTGDEVFVWTPSPQGAARGFTLQV